MGIIASCPCGARYSAVSSLAGKTVRCRACGLPFDVPDRDGRPAAGRQALEPEIPSYYHTQPQYSHSQPPRYSDEQVLKFAKFGIGGVVVIGVIVVLSLAVDGIVEKMGKVNRLSDVVAVAPQTAPSEREPLAARETVSPLAGRTLKTRSANSGPANGSPSTGVPSAGSWSAAVVQHSGGRQARTAPVERPTLTLADLIELVEPSVVRIDTRSVEDGRSFEAIGSGFIVDSQGTIVTNYHVIAGVREATVTSRSGSKYEVLGYLAADPSKDLAVIRTRPLNGCVPFTFSTAPPRKGDAVAAFGSPLGFDFSATEGIVSAVRSGRQIAAALKDTAGIDIYSVLGYGKNTEWIQTTAAISGGNSGGPLVNMRGELIGVNTWSHGQGQNLNFAATVDEVRHVLRTAGQTPHRLADLASSIPRRSGGSREGGARPSDTELVETSPSGAAFIPGDMPEVARQFEGHQGPIWDVAVSPDGRYLATCARGGKTFVFDMSGGSALYVIHSPLSPIRELAFSEAPNYLATFRAARFDRCIRLREAHDGREVTAVSTLNISDSASLAVSPDARTVVATWSNGEAHLWRFDVLRESVIDFPLGTARHKLLRASTFSPDGKYLVTGDSTGELTSWTGAGNVLSQASSEQGHRGMVHSLAFSPNGKTLVSGGEDGVLRVWHNWSGKRWRKQEFGEQSAEILTVDCSPDGSLIAAGRADGGVELWDLSRKKLLRRYASRSGPVTALCFTKHGRFLVTGCADGVVRILHLPTES